MLDKTNLSSDLLNRHAMNFPVSFVRLIIIQLMNNNK